MNIEDIENSNAYQVWLYNQYEPEEKLFVGRPPKKELPGWMLKARAMEELDEKAREEREDDFLKKHGI